MINLVKIYTFLQGKELKKKNAREWAGACPACGGEDRFVVWPQENRCFCRVCNKSYDAIAFLREFHNMSFVEACHYLGENQKLERKPISVKKNQVVKWEPKIIEKPAEKWRQRADTFVKWAHSKLLSMSDKVDWLRCERGLSVESIEKYCLGWNSIDIYRNRKDWGIEIIGKIRKIFIPAGLVIPAYREKTCYRMKIRRDKVEIGKNRYHFLAGGRNICLLVGEGKDIVIVESELDALLLAQEAGELITAVALGSCANKPDRETFEAMNKAENIFVALDFDNAGEKASWEWQKFFPFAKRLIFPGGKDVTDSWHSGINLKEFIRTKVEALTLKKWD